MAYTVSGLTDYVKENEAIILKDLVFGNAYGDTIPLMAKQLGVKDKARIHPSTIDVTLHQGKTIARHVHHSAKQLHSGW